MAIDKCVVCSKSVFALERQGLGKDLVCHKACFRCKECRRSLTPSNFFLESKEILCKKHHNEKTKDPEYQDKRNEQLRIEEEKKILLQLENQRLMEEERKRRIEEKRLEASRLLRLKEKEERISDMVSRLKGPILDEVDNDLSLSTTQEGELGWQLSATRFITTISLEKPIFSTNDTLGVRAHFFDAHSLVSIPKVIMDNCSHTFSFEVLNTERIVVHHFYGYWKNEAVYGHTSLFLPGGDYKLRLSVLPPRKGVYEFGQTEREFSVQAYAAPPTLRKHLEFAQKGYGPGDRVCGRLEVTAAEGGVPLELKVTASGQSNGKEFYNSLIELNEDGSSIISFTLPETVTPGPNTVLSVSLDDGAVTESISKTIPILKNNISVKFYPEGGSIIEGLVNQVYAECFLASSDPADIEAVIFEKHPNGEEIPIERFHTVHEGRGKFEFTPKPNHSYRCHIIRPDVGDYEPQLPEILENGIVLHAVKECYSAEEDLEVCIGSTNACVLLAQVFKKDLLIYQEEVSFSEDTIQKSHSYLTSYSSAPVSVFGSLLKDSTSQLSNPSIDLSLFGGGTLPTEFLGESTSTVATVNEGEEEEGEGSNPVLSHPAMKVVPFGNNQLNEKGFPYGVLRITVSDKRSKVPFCERLVYRACKEKLQVQLVMDKTYYTTEEGPVIAVKVTQQDGSPLLGAVVTLNVVDDSALQMQEKRLQHPHLPAMVLLESDVHHLRDMGVYLPEFTPNSSIFSPTVLDLLLGVQGWRKFIFSFTCKKEKDTFLATYPDIAPALLSRSFISIDQMELISAPPALVSSPHFDEAEFYISSDSSDGEDDDFELPSRLVPTFKNSRRRKEGARGGGGGGARGRGRGSDIAPPSGPPPPPSRQTQSARSFSLTPLGGLLATRSSMRFDQKEKKKSKKKRKKNANKKKSPTCKGRCGQLVVNRQVYFHHKDIVQKTSRDVLANQVEKVDENGIVVFHAKHATSVTQYRVIVSCFHPAQAKFGHSSESFVNVKKPFFLRTNFPLSLTTDDKLLLPIGVANASEESVTNGKFTVHSKKQVAYNALAKKKEHSLYPIDSDPFELSPNSHSRQLLPLHFPSSGRYKVCISSKVQISFPKKEKEAEEEEEEEVQGVDLLCVENTYSDSQTFVCTVFHRDFPQKIRESNSLKKNCSIPFSLEGNGNKMISCALYLHIPNGSSVVQEYRHLIREPHGCTEQVASSCYLMAMAIQRIRIEGTSPAQFKSLEQCEEKLAAGFKKLKNMECPSGGFDWWSSSNAHLGVTAFVLHVLQEMKSVYKGTDDALIQSTLDWIMAQRSGNGRFTLSTTASAYGRGSKTVIEAYVLWVLTSNGKSYESLQDELDFLFRYLSIGHDTYVIALIALTMSNVGHDEKALKVGQRLANDQAKEGFIKHCETSITNSFGSSLVDETTSLAVLGWLNIDPERFQDNIESALKFLQKSFGMATTQASALSVKAKGEYQKWKVGCQESLSYPDYEPFEILLDGKSIVRYETESEYYGVYDHYGCLRVDFNEVACDGDHLIEIVNPRATGLFYYFEAFYTSLEPRSHLDAPLDLVVQPARENLSVGENLGISVTVINREDRTSGMVIAQIGIPSGLLPNYKQLQESVKAKVFSYYEVKDSVLTIYWRGFLPLESKEFLLNFIAFLPGEFASTPSRVYPYYAPEYVQWISPLTVTIQPTTK